MSATDIIEKLNELRDGDMIIVEIQQGLLRCSYHCPGYDLEDWHKARKHFDYLFNDTLQSLLDSFQ